MKNLCCILLLFISINSTAQDISGLYSGTLTNDSLKMIQNYELALSEYKGKITGFSYITFVANDTFYYGIKRIKATRVNGELVVEDVQMLMNNYPQKADKGVHLINRIPLPNADTITDLNGKWETTKTKKFYAISGDMSLRKDDDSTKSPLIAHLKELKMIDYQDEKKPDNRNVAKTDQKQKNSGVKEVPKETKSKEPIATQAVAKETVVTKSSAETVAKPKTTEQPKALETQPAVAEVKPNTVAAAKPIVKQETLVDNKSTNTQPKQTTESASRTASPEVRNSVVVNPTSEQKIATEPITQKTTQVVSTKSANRENNPAAEQQPSVIAAQTKIVTAASSTVTALPEVIEKRVNNTIQTVNVVSDSLVLSFYDNGVVDGDSISVFLNGENIISKVKLKEAAVKKTIYLNNAADEVRLTLVAENLGSIPPNTGLLIIQDARDKYQIRFSADMETNASVIIKKNKK
jgi:hypothetical protein